MAARWRFSLSLSAPCGSKCAGRLHTGQHLLARQHEIEFNVVERRGQFDLGGGLGVVDLSKLGEQALLHAEHRVGIDKGIIRIEDMGSQGVESVGLDDVMQMRWTIGMASQRTEQLADRSVIGDGIVSWLDAAEPIAPIRSSAEDAAQVEVGLDAF